MQILQFVSLITMFLGRRHSHPEEPRIDFRKILQDSTTSVLTLLEIDDIIEQVRLGSTVFAKCIGTRTELVRELIDYAFRPQKEMKIPSRFPYICVEILCSQQLVFFDWLLGRPMEFADKDEDSVNCSHSNPESTELLEYVFEVLNTSAVVDETAAGYLARFFGQLCQKKAGELFEFMVERPVIMNRLFQHTYSLSVTDIILKMVFNQTATIEMRVSMIASCVKAASEEKQPKILRDRLNNISFILAEVSEKCQDRYEGSNFQSFLSKFHHLQKLRHLVKTAVLLQDREVTAQLLDMFINMIKSEKTYREAHDPDNKESHKSEFWPQVSTEESVWLVEVLVQLQPSVMGKEDGSTSLCFAKFKWLTLLRDLLFLKPQSSKQIMNINTVHQIMRLIIKHPTNNILHNLCRDILVCSIKFGNAASICSHQCGFLSFILEAFSKNNLWVAQLYPVAKEIQAKRKVDPPFQKSLRYFREQWTLFVENDLRDKTIQYHMLLGGENPKKTDDDDNYYFCKEPETSQEPSEEQEIEQPCLWSQSDSNEVLQHQEGMFTWQDSQNQNYMENIYWAPPRLEYDLQSLLQEVEQNTAQSL